MHDNFEKTKELLTGDKTKTGIALKALAMELDNKFAELDQKNDERHAAILLAIKESKAETDKKICDVESATQAQFSKIKFIIVIAEHWKLIVSIVVIVLIAVGFIRNEEIKEWFKILK